MNQEYTLSKLLEVANPTHVDDCECTCYLSHDVKLTNKVQVSLEF